MGCGMVVDEFNSVENVTALRVFGDAYLRDVDCYSLAWYNRVWSGVGMATSLRFLFDLTRFDRTSRIATS